MKKNIFFKSIAIFSILLLNNITIEASARSKNYSLYTDSSDYYDLNIREFNNLYGNIDMDTASPELKAQRNKALNKVELAFYIKKELEGQLEKKKKASNAQKHYIALCVRTQSRNEVKYDQIIKDLNNSNYLERSATKIPENQLTEFTKKVIGQIHQKKIS